MAVTESQEMATSPLSSMSASKQSDTILPDTMSQSHFLDAIHRHCDDNEADSQETSVSDSSGEFLAFCINEDRKASTEASVEDDQFGSLQQDFARLKSVDDEVFPQEMEPGESTQVDNCDNLGQSSSPAITNEGRTRVHKHRGIMTVKTLAESLEPVDTASAYSSYISARRRRRKTKTATAGGGVTFGTCEVREYPIIMGDNPGGYMGPPLTIGWEPQDQVVITVDDFESEHPPRRFGSQLNMPKEVREDMLRNAGFSRGEIQSGMREINISRSQRKRTVELLHMEKVEEWTERAWRATANALYRRGNKQQERTYLKEAMELHQALSRGRREDC